MTVLSNEMKAFITPWLDRVTAQLAPEPEKIKEAEKKCDHDASQTSLMTSSRILEFIIASSQRPSVEQHGLINTHNITTNVSHHYHTTHTQNVSNAGARPEESSSAETKKTKEKKPEVNWKNILIITTVCTVIASVSVFVYTRLVKTEERAQNYLAKTKMIKDFAEGSIHRNNQGMLALKEVANAQKEIDKKAVDKITGYKRATLSTLVGVVVGASGAIAMPWFATAGTIGGLFGLITIGGSAVGATYNLANHWSDKKEAQEKLKEIQSSLDYLTGKTSPNIENQGSSSTERQPAYNPSFYDINNEELPPSYIESQQTYGYGYVGTERLYPKLPEYQKA